MLIKEPLLSDYEMINVHPSLLPRWRGAAPIERAIMAGDAETGVAIMRVTAGWDSGAGLRARAARRSSPTTTTARSPPRLETIGADLLVKVLDERPTPVEQDEAYVTYAHKIGAARARAGPDADAARRSSARSARCARTSARGCRCPTARFLGVLAARVDGPTRAPAGGLRAHRGRRGCCWTATAARSS